MPLSRYHYFLDSKRRKRNFGSLEDNDDNTFKPPTKKRDTKGNILKIEESKDQPGLCDPSFQDDSLPYCFNVDGGSCGYLKTQQSNNFESDDHCEDSIYFRVYSKCKQEFYSKCLMIDGIYEDILTKLQQSSGFFNIFNCRSSDIARYQHRLNDYIKENISVIENLKDKLVVL